MKVLLFFTSMLLVQLALAKGPSVQHEHNGRTHNHVLPNGIKNHSHNSGNHIKRPAVSKPVSRLIKIDLIGIIPGVFTKKDVQNKKHTNASGGYYRIGGFMLENCFDYYINGFLSEFNCTTGGITSSGDFNGNFKIYEVFLKGFTKKFGSPTKITNGIRRNEHNVAFKDSVALWRDAIGNELKISTIFGDVHRGLIVLRSSEHNRRRDKKKLDKENNRIF